MKKILGKSGIAGVSIAIIGAIVIVVIIATILIPILFLKINVSRTVEIEYNYNNAELVMLTLLSDEHLYRELSLYVAGLPDNEDNGFIRSDVEVAAQNRLDKLVTSGCFKLYYSGTEDSEIIITKADCDPVYGATADISLPYGENTEQIMLEIK